MCVTTVAVSSLLSFFSSPLYVFLRVACLLWYVVYIQMSTGVILGYLLIIFRLTHFVNYGEMFCHMKTDFSKSVCLLLFFPSQIVLEVCCNFTQCFFFLLPFLFILSRTTWCQRSMWKQCANQCWTSALFPATSKYVMSFWQSWVAFHKRYGL